MYRSTHIATCTNISWLGSRTPPLPHFHTVQYHRYAQSHLWLHNWFYKLHNWFYKLRNWFYKLGNLVSDYCLNPITAGYIF